MVHYLSLSNRKVKYRIQAIVISLLYNQQKIKSILMGSDDGVLTLRINRLLEFVHRPVLKNSKN
jgi:hypothetical protein